MENMQTMVLEERKKIEYWLRLQYKFRDIGRRLGRPHTTISREVERNTESGKRYSAVYAQSLTDMRASKRKRGCAKLDKNDELRWFVHYHLFIEKWAPHVIAGYIKTQKPPELAGASVCTETIFRYIYESEGGLGWYKYLLSPRRYRIKHGKRKSHSLAIAMRLPIHCRPQEINDRVEIGHWETDSVKYDCKALSVQSERVSKKFCMHKISNMTAEETLTAQIKTFESVPEGTVRSLTYDNGKEGALHYRLKEFCRGIETFFCDSYASWQKGGVENVNGIIRRHIPRGTDLDTLTDYDIYTIQEKINNTPRKILNYLTPNQVFATLSMSLVH